MRETRQIRSIQAELKTRADEGQDMTIEGYFAVFGRETELWPGAFEEIAAGAFDETLGNDIRALINHDTTLVLGRNKAGTLELKTDSYGLWGRVKINLRHRRGECLQSESNGVTLTSAHLASTSWPRKRTGGMTGR